MSPNTGPNTVPIVLSCLPPPPQRTLSGRSAGITNVNPSYLTGMGIRLHGELGKDDEQRRERQRAAGRKYEEAHAGQRREKQRLAAQRRRERITCVPPGEQEKIRTRQRIHNANYRANHRSHLRKASMRRRTLTNPNALPRQGCLRKPKEYTAHQLAHHGLVNTYKIAKRRCMKNVPETPAYLPPEIVKSICRRHMRHMLPHVPSHQAVYLGHRPCTSTATTTRRQARRSTVKTITEDYDADPADKHKECNEDEDIDNPGHRVPIIEDIEYPSSRTSSTHYRGHRVPIIEDTEYPSSRTPGTEDQASRMRMTMVKDAA
ncbi:hypothetical protein BDZ89DRAFT_1052509 [Hymenopellis radicata]|nr:hypothetical protein BDZ89DRAFT_1052509 [Hymenopellis radicata]